MRGSSNPCVCRNPLAGIEVVGSFHHDRWLRQAQPTVVIPWRGLRCLGDNPRHGLGTKTS